VLVEAHEDGVVADLGPRLEVEHHPDYYSLAPGRPNGSRRGGGPPGSGRRNRADLGAGAGRGSGGGEEGLRRASEERWGGESGEDSYLGFRARGNEAEQEERWVGLPFSYSLFIYFD
jgi:hypothetical protein